MKILIVQDFPAIGRLEAQLLTNLGHEVTWVIGFKDVTKLEGYLPDKTVSPIGYRFDVAIVDGQVYGPSGKVETIGSNIVAHLVESGVGCVIANSSKDHYNAEMVERGAHRAINQLVLFVTLVIAKLTTPEDLLAPSDAAAELFCMDFVTFAEGLGKPFRDATEAALMAD